MAKIKAADSNVPASVRRHDKWAEHRRWLARADQVATTSISKGGSPHPSVRVGAVLVDAKGQEIASAANRFPYNVDRRRPERYKKWKQIFVD